MDLYNAVQQFGKKVLEYLLSTSADGDTILFAIDDDIYESTLFDGNSTEKEQFESQIKKYVKYHGLDFSSDDYIALALAAHQIKLAYDSKSVYDTEEKIVGKKSINDTLMSFYFPGELYEQILYKTYYDSLNNVDDNLQDKLWKRVRDLLTINNRKCIIPIGLKGKNREQKYINAQLIVLRSLKYYFIRIFYFAGISKNLIYTRESFEKCIQENLSKNNSNLLKHILNVIQERLRKYASENDTISFSYDERILVGQLWNFYNTWDGSDPVFSDYPDDYYDSDIFYIELFEEDEEGPAFFESQKKLDHNSTGIDITREIYFRVFLQHSDDWWKSEVLTCDVPDFTPFAILVEKEEIRRFSEKNRTIYYGEDENTKRYVVIKYDRKPDDFYAKLPNHYNQTDINKINLVGGIKLNRNEYLDVGIEKALPQLIKNNNLHITERTDDMKLFKKVEIIGEKSNIISKYKLIPHQNNSLPSNCECCRGAIINGLCVPTKKAVIKLQKKIVTEVPEYTFRTQLNIQSQKTCIPYEDLKIQVDSHNGSYFISLDSLDEKSGISSDDLTRLKRGIGFGWFGLDDTPVLKNNIWFIKEIEFKVELSKDKFLYDFEITEFRVTDVLEVTQKLSNGNVITKKHNEIKDYCSKRPKNIESDTIKPKKYNYKVTNEDLSSFHKTKTECFYKYDLFCYQEALYLWLKHKGFANWQQIHNQCSKLVQTSGFYSSFGDRPEYKIFMPMLKIGIIEIYQMNGEYIYGVSTQIGLFDSERNEFSYREHFLNQKNEKIDLHSSQVRALSFLRSLPNIIQIIKENNIYYSEDLSDDEKAIICFSTNSFKRELRFTSGLSSEVPCIFKYKKESYEPDYFYLNEKAGRFKINRNIPDSYTVCKAYINSERIMHNSKKGSLFTYYPNEKKLVCHYLPDVPVLYVRALILNDPIILDKEDIYLSNCPDHYEQVFSNISEEFAQLLDKKYTERG